jgi:predicted RNase H-like HicB family nuclease
MIQNYINEALEKAKYEILGDTGEFYGEIPECRGVYATAATLEQCRNELIEVLDEWIVLRLRKNLGIPILEGIDLNIAQEEMEYATA